MRNQDKRRGRAMIAVTCIAAVAVAAVVSGCNGGGSHRPEGTAPIVTPSASQSPSEAVEAVEAIDTSDWTTYTSDLYDLEIGHPPGWAETPATRKWRLDRDATDVLSPAHETFRSPEGDVRVSVWAAPLNPKTREETRGYFEAWVGAYCEASGNAPCTGIDERGVDLCLERRDCHPGLLVPFQNDVQAFFSGGVYAGDAMTIVAVWRSESDSSVTKYGGAQRLLEAFLSTMQVWPAKP